MEKIKSLTRNEKKRKELKNVINKKILKSPERRTTRKMVKSNNKKKKGVIVKHAIDTISIVSLRQKKMNVFIMNTKRLNTFSSLCCLNLAPNVSVFKCSLVSEFCSKNIELLLDAT